MAHPTHEIWLHVILSTKNNRPLLEDEWRSQFCYHLKRKAKEDNLHVDYVNGVADHLHFLLKMNVELTPKKMVNKIKRLAPDWFKENKVLKGKFQWATDFSIFSVSPSEVAQVRAYIKQQKELHSDFPLSDESVILRKKG